MTKFPINLFNIAKRHKEDEQLPNTIFIVYLSDPNSLKLYVLLLYSHELINLSVYKILEGNPLSAELLISNIVRFINSLFNQSLEVRRVCIYCYDDSNSYHLYSLYAVGKTSKGFSSVEKDEIPYDYEFLYRLIRFMTMDDEGDLYYAIDLSSYAINKIFNNVL